MLDDFLPPTNLWNKLSLFLFITWGGRKTNDKWQKYLVWYDHHKLIATRIYFIWLCFASLNWYPTKVYPSVSPRTINVCKLIRNTGIYKISYRSLKRIYLSPASGKILQWISKKHHRSCCLSSKQNQIPKIVWTSQNHTRNPKWRLKIDQLTRTRNLVNY